MESLTPKISFSSPIKHDAHQSLPSSTGLVVSTPDRMNPLSQTRTRNAVVHRPNVEPLNLSRLPQKYTVLCEYFNALVSSIRLLRLKRVPTYLTKLSRSIESLTDRRFTLHHLAQLKYIVPEIIVVEKIRNQDSDTGCVKEDLLVLLEFNAIKLDKFAKGSDGYSQFKRIFRTRISHYASLHPEGDDVPKCELPELFYKRDYEVDPIMSRVSPLQPNMLIAPSFKKRFSHKTHTKTSSSTKDKVCSTHEICVDVATPLKHSLTPSKIGSTPPSCSSTPAKFFMTTTPTLNKFKRPLMDDDDDDSSIDLQSKSMKRRALNFNDDIDVQVDKDLQQVLPPKLLHSLINKKLKTIKEQDPLVLQAQKRQRLMAAVPKLQYMVQLLFQSTNRSVMTKEELIHKIIVGRLDIVDKREIEEQLELLQELAPDFLIEQSSIAGDTLLRINKSSFVDDFIPIQGDAYKVSS